MRKTREYKGCELESPIYRQIVAEGYYKDKINRVNEYKTKRGKNSKI
tara:strand:- start:979 stop:1119 length:141 start_codon:yes stop_codon:yes gene_type:complete